MNEEELIKYLNDRHSMPNIKIPAIAIAFCTVMNSVPKDDCREKSLELVNMIFDSFKDRKPD